MPIFYYKAKNKVAETTHGQILAQSKEEAIEKINQLELMPIVVEDAAGETANAPHTFAGKVKVKDLYTFSRQLASLIKAGLPLLSALQVIEQQLSNLYFRSIISTIILEIKDGKSLADCLAQHPQVFSSLYVAMIRAGEESGQLKDMLVSVAEYLRNQHEIITKVKTALAYPLIMLIVGLATVVFMLTYVMPRLAHLFVDMQQSLPLPTVIVMASSELLRKWWIVILLIIFVLAFFMSRWSSSSAGRVVLSRLQLHLPLWGPFILKVELARFCRSLELLLKSGISILRGLKLASPIVGNVLLREQLERCHDEVAGGNSLGESLKRSKNIPVIVGDLIAVGEESGSLTHTLQEIADDYEREINETIKVMTTLLEPIMIIVMGAVIGFMVMAMLLPIFQLDIFSR